VITLEVAIESADDAKAADGGGANRLELCAALDLGGLTPTIGQIEEVQSVTPLPVMVMLRPRDGDFVYSESELATMERDLRHLVKLAPMGFVFGALNADATVNSDACRRFIDIAAGRPCTFHRAFDRTNDNRRALEEVIALGFTRVLTSGKAPTALAGIENLTKLVNLAMDRIAIVPCGRVRALNVGEIVRQTRCTELHGSFAEPVPESNDLARQGYVQRSRTSREAVALCRTVLGK
jgi:copper homeostasis protein